jgi:hypothetical protein
MSGTSKFVTSPQAADPDPSKPDSGLQPCHPVNPDTGEPIELNPVAEEIQTADPETIAEVLRAMQPPASPEDLVCEEKIPLKPSLNDPRLAKGDPQVRDSRKPHGPTAMATSEPMEIRSAPAPNDPSPPSADPSVASPPPSQPSAEAYAARLKAEEDPIKLALVHQSQRLLDPTLQARALQNTLGFIGMRLEVLPDSSRHQMIDLLMWIMESDMESGVTETMFKEIKSVSRSVWADDKITNMILCLRACEAASRFFLGPLGVE